MTSHTHPYAELAARLGGQARCFTTSEGELTGYTAGDLGASTPVILVHGWPEFASCWEPIARELLKAGHPIIAYDQRGYSPGLRPEALEEYTVEKLVNDLGEVANAAGVDRFHLVGHDWGGVMGWAAVPHMPDRTATFTSLASAHTRAHGEMIAKDSDQYERMEYLRKIRHHPDQIVTSMLRDDAAKLRAVYQGVIPRHVEDSYVQRFSDAEVFAASLKYYRALGLGTDMATQPITVPTLYVWGERGCCVCALFR
ncbi:hypothetical protein HMPREF0183_1185 [Brevibacterium mcbrellneri ATCC 49030]|uniref:AB hydrolase-1 domain-containing protein n=1 Tax=Brevibacterium mcbrellneri ATCC 49030 TaxID=585530 RepID=D4YMM5_9MICO|nr:alpha/beta fold hydrolase [Brevibacterium mcbrellneri]EFG47543.1 hypothetical protein HMPREF0183_1185 [Brevibacterium mcbrellneri ATCC 49030]